MKTNLSRRNFIKTLAGAAAVIAAPAAVLSALRPASSAPQEIPVLSDNNLASFDDTEAWLFGTGKPHIHSLSGFMFT